MLGLQCNMIQCKLRQTAEYKIIQYNQYRACVELQHCLRPFNHQWLNCFLRGVSVALNVQYSADACQNAAYDSKCSIILVSTETQCLRIFEVKARLPHLKAVVQLPMESSDPFDSDIHTVWSQAVVALPSIGAI